MGAGSSALIWYGLCVAFVAFVVIVSTGLIFYGQLVENRRRDRAKTGADVPRTEDEGAEDVPSSLDPTPSDR
jgi:hypothetical protein